MGQLIEGKWLADAELAEIGDKGEFERPESVFREWIQVDPKARFPAEANRYHLYISYACPWASRTLIMRKLKGLEQAISFTYVDAFLGEQGWTFGQSGDDTRDPLMKSAYLHEIYTAADTNYTGRVTVPVLWDKKTKAIINNESADIMRMLDVAFQAIAKDKTDYYPETLRADIDEINDFVYPNVNNGVYKCGFAKTQEAYDEAFDNLFAALDKLEHRLSQQRYLVGNVLTEADWRLFTTLIRFDAVYVCHFKTNLHRIDDYPNLSQYMRDLYQHPGIEETVRFDHIKNHYFMSHIKLNPRGIVAKGPWLDYNRPHNREQFTK